MGQLFIVGSAASHLQGCSLAVRDLDILISDLPDPELIIRSLSEKLGVADIDATPFPMRNPFLRNQAIELPLDQDSFDWIAINVVGLEACVPPAHVLLCHRLKTISDIGFQALQEGDHHHFSRLARKLFLLEREADFYWNHISPERLAAYLLGLPNCRDISLFLREAAEFAGDFSDSGLVPALLEEVKSLFETVAAADAHDVQVDCRPRAAALRQCHVQLLSDCRLRCTHCPYHWTGTVLALGVLEERSREWAAWGIKEVNLGAACEPLMYEALGEAVDLLVSLGFMVNISSSLATDISTEKLAGIAAKCSNFAISLDEFHFRNAPAKIPPSIKEKVRAIVEAGTYVTASFVYEVPCNIEVEGLLDAVQDLGARRVALLRRVSREFQEIWTVSDLATYQAVRRTVTASDERSLDVILRNTDPILFCLDPLRHPLEAQNLSLDGSFSIFLTADGEYLKSQASMI